MEKGLDVLLDVGKIVLVGHPHDKLVKRFIFTLFSFSPHGVQSWLTCYMHYFFFKW